MKHRLPPLYPLLKNLPVAVLFSLVTMVVNGQSPFKEFDNSLFLNNYSVRDGLSEESVNVVYKDRRGIVWVGTDGGLNRFNSYEFEVYRADTSLNSISNNIVYDIGEDEFGALWVATIEGLNEYLPTENGFKVYNFGKISTIEDMWYDSLRNSLWLAMISDGLVQFNVLTKEATRYVFLPSDIFINRIQPITADSLALGTPNQGVFLVNVKTRKMRHVHSGKQELSLNNDAVKALLVCNDQLWVGTDGGLNVLNVGENSRRIFDENSPGFSSRLIVSLTKGPDEKVWVGTDGGGISVVDLDSYSTVNYIRNYSDRHALQSNVIREIFVDDHENIWIGTYKKGFGVHPHKSAFLNNVNLDFTMNLANSSVTSFAPKNDSIIYIGTDGSGLMECDGRTFRRIALDQACHDCFDEKVLSLDRDKKGNLWIGTFSKGLFRMNRKGEIKNYTTANSRGLGSNSIWQMQVDAKGDLWMATSAGLSHLDTETMQFETYFPENVSNLLAAMDLRSLIIDNAGKVWVGGFLGVFAFDVARNSFTAHYSAESEQLPLKGNVVLSLLLDKDQNLWVGTYGQGIQALDLKNNEFVYKETLDNLGSMVVNFISEDAKGNIWIGTNSGIIGLDVQGPVVYPFNTNNGLQDDVYNIGASAIMADSVLFAGGVSGFTFLNTFQLKGKPPTAGIVLEKITYENDALGFDPYEQPSTPEFRIDYSRSNLNFSFAALDYGNVGVKLYSYFLRNFDKQWSLPSDIRQASYTNLPPGTYEFMVKIHEYPLMESEPVSLATIQVTPAWWMTIWFKIAISIVLVCTLFAFVSYRTIRHRRARKELMDAVKQKTSEIERQKEELNHKNLEIEKRNRELLYQNESLQSLNEELNSQKETIDEQRRDLESAHSQLKEVNNELEKIVDKRTEELHITIEELNKTISELDSFVYSASHDLGAPLKSILGLIHIAMLETRDEAIAPHLNLMQTSVKKLEEVIHSLIQYSRNNRMELKPQSINIYQLVNDCFNTLKFMSGYEDIKFQNRIPDDCVIFSDESRLRIILRNLLSNAIKYSDKDKDERFIHVYYSECGQKKCRITVEDNGLGIGRAHQEKIFKMFYRANESIDGSGLGLYIVKEAMDKLNGEIFVESEVSVGTKIHLELNGVDAGP